MYEVQNMKKYWAALDENNVIIAVGFTLDQARFEFQIFPFTCQCMERWLRGGGKYCQISSIKELLQLGRAYVKRNLIIANFKHGPIRKSRRAQG